MSITFIPVESSNIEKIGYDANAETLYIVFRSGASIYRYDDVPATTYLDFLRSESYGKFFHASIKTRFVCTNVGHEFPLPRIVVAMDGSMISVVGATIDCAVIILDRDQILAGEEGTFTHNLKAITNTELDRSIRLDENNFPSQEEQSSEG